MTDHKKLVQFLCDWGNMPIYQVRAIIPMEVHLPHELQLISHLRRQKSKQRLNLHQKQVTVWKKNIWKDWELQYLYVSYCSGIA